MLARAYRFHGHNSLSFVYRTGETARTPELALRFAANSRRNTYRTAIVVSKKLSKSAVVRNRIRRRVYEQVRGLVSLTTTHDLVFTAYSDRIDEMSERELNAIIRRLLQIADIHTK